MNQKEQSTGGYGPLLIVVGIAGSVFLLLRLLAAPEPANVGEEPSEATATGEQSVTDTEDGSIQDVPTATESVVQPETPAQSEPQEVIVDATPSEVDDTVEAGEAASAIRVKMPWDSWPKPQLAFILTGEQHGYFEPCGCTSNQLGGMSRRANLVQKMQDAGWNVRGLDVGGLSRRSVRQSQIKFETTIAAFKQLKYIAIGIGPEELRLRPDFLLTQHLVDGDSPIHFLSANLVFYETPELGTPAPSVIVEENGVKIGVTSVMSDGLQKLIFPYPDVTWKDPEPELKKVVADFEKQTVDLKVLLSQSTLEESQELATQFPQFQIVLTAEGTGDPDPAAPPQKVGDTLLIETGRKGKYVGVLGFYPEDKETPFRYQLVALEREDFDETPEMVKLMEGYQERLKDEQIVLADAISAPHPSGATFVGADKCGECHSHAFDIWKDTKHAHALDSLDPIHKRTGFERLNGINRSFDPECLSCHVVGWDPQEYIRFRSGFLNEEFAADPAEKTLHKLLGGNQCENCHGPGSQHIADVDVDAEDVGKTVRVTYDQAENGMCEKCHDADNSPKFDFAKYWEQVKHDEPE